MISGDNAWFKSSKGKYIWLMRDGFTHTEDCLFTHTEEEVFVLQGFKRLVFGLFGIIGYEDDYLSLIWRWSGAS